MLDLTGKWGSEKYIEAFSSHDAPKTKAHSSFHLCHSIMHFTIINAYMYACVYIYIHTHRAIQNLPTIYVCTRRYTPMSIYLPS